MDRKEDEIKNIYQGTQESREVEFKRSFKWKHHLTRASLGLIKTVIALFNTPRGGTVIYGIKQERNNSNIEYEGLSDDEIQLFEENEEKIKRLINSFSTTNIAPFFLLIEDPKIEKTFMTISVAGYKEYPALIKKDGKFKNKEGKEIICFRMHDLLSRTLHPPYSSCKVSQVELNEMIELCAKGLRTKCKEILNLDTQNEPEVEENKFKEERIKEYGQISA